MLEKLQKILSLLKENADLADVFWEETSSVVIVSENKRIEKINVGRDSGIGLRTIRNGKTAYGVTNEIDFSNLSELANFLSKKIKTQDVNLNLSFKYLPEAKFKIKLPPWEVDLEKKKSFIQRAEEVAWGESPLIRQVRVLYREVLRHIRIITSLGHISQQRQNYLLFYVQVVAQKDGVLQTGYEPIGTTKGLELFEEKSPEKVAQVATNRALKMIKAPAAPSGTMPVVLSSEAGGTMIHEAIGHGLEVDLALEGLSVYANKSGEKVASPLITVIDDPTLEGNYGFYVYDDEGVAAKKTVLIEKGILKTYLYNLEYALKQGIESNGHGRRQSYRSKPIPRMANTYIAPGQRSPIDIIGTVDKGLFVKKMGGGEVNTINGNFVFEASEAYLLEKGKIGEPVRGATLVGNGPKILKSIAMVGNDLNFGLGTCGKDGQLVPVSDGQPTILIPKIVIGGTG
jgi:TldD protein